jgi:hypothetical protein
MEWPPGESSKGGASLEEERAFHQSERPHRGLMQAMENRKKQPDNECRSKGDDFITETTEKGGVHGEALIKSHGIKGFTF